MTSNAIVTALERRLDVTAPRSEVATGRIASPDGCGDGSAPAAGGGGREPGGPSGGSWSLMMALGWYRPEAGEHKE